MSLSTKDIVFLILQFLGEERFEETRHKLEEESGFFFNMEYFEKVVTNGEWEEVENYLSGFTKVFDNDHSKKIFFEIRKQKYLEALDKGDRARAVDILWRDLKVFSATHGELYKEMTQLLTLKNLRENEQLSPYGDTKSTRALLLTKLMEVIESNPVFSDKLQFPHLRNQRLRTLINQSLNWPTSFVRIQNPILNPKVPRVGVHPSIGGPVHDPAFRFSLAEWIANPYSVLHQTISKGPLGLKPPNNVADFEHLLMRSTLFRVPEEVNNMNIPPALVSSQGHAHSMHSTDDLPKNVVANLNQSSAVKSIDFHPARQTILLVGTNFGESSLWEVIKGEKIWLRNFYVWDLEACSTALQASLANEYAASVNRVLWSSDGRFFGVAYSKHIVQLYAYYGVDDLRNHLEIDAHVGSVNDLAFSRPDNQFFVITCGEDKTIKVWDAAAKGTRLYTFEGHEAPVYSICSHEKENTQFIISTAIDGKIKAWLYDNLGSRVDYDAPGHSHTTMAYSTDGTRLFSCGTSKNGESYIVEWNEIQGSIKRTYAGLGKHTVGVVQFDTTKNRFLAAGDESKIKFWDMDNENLLASIDADGGLPATPCIRFCNRGALLAVSTIQNGIKILANAEGMQLRSSKAPVIGTFVASTSAAGPSKREDRSSPMDLAITRKSKFPDAKSRISDELYKSKVWKPTEIDEPVQLRNLRLPDTILVRILRLTYTKSGSSILALAYNALHKLWKWQQGDAPGKASTSVPPKLWQPSREILMTNYFGETSLEKAVPCFALSKNDSYVVSASGGKISLFNMGTFKRMKTFMPPPPAATSLAFHPQNNNVIAIGMEDSSIQIYNFQVDKVIAKLEGHKKRVTGLAFSSVLGLLVSSSADLQLCVWTLEEWQKKASKLLPPIPLSSRGREVDDRRQTRLQFHQDQMHVMVVHETRIAIYEASRLDLINQWISWGGTPKITDATYSCDSQSILACLASGNVYIFTAPGLELRCKISPRAYMPSQPRSSKLYNIPLVITSHPREANQFALGLSDGGVHVLEPLESEGQWGTAPPDDGAAAGTSKSGAGDQSLR